MNGSGFERVREVVLACFDLPIRERTEYLGALARHDPELAAAFVELDFTQYDRYVKAHRAAETSHGTAPKDAS